MNGLKRPVVIDGAVYCGIAWFAAWTAALTTDNAAKFINESTLFWLKAICESSGALLLALKMYRSTTFAEHRQEQKESETAFIARQLTKPP